MGKRHPGVTPLGRGRYQLRVQLREPGGRSRKEVKRIVRCESLRDAVAERQTLLEAVISGDVGEQRERLTLADFAESWLRAKKRRLAVSTAERYASALDLHIGPVLGGIYLDRLTRWHIERWMGDKQDSGRYQASTINGWLRVLKTITAAAVPEYIDLDPAARVDPLPEPLRDENDPNALNEEELGRLLAAFREHAPDQFPLVALMATTGLRWGEATALKWEDLDREAGIIRIRRAHWHGHLKGTKTKRNRKVPLGPKLLAVLDAWRAELVRQQHPGLEAGWCFPSSTGGLRFNSTMTNSMRVCLERAGITKRVTPSQGIRRSAEDGLRRLGVGGAVGRGSDGSRPEDAQSLQHCRRRRGGSHRSGSRGCHRASRRNGGRFGGRFGSEKENAQRPPKLTERLYGICWLGAAGFVASAPGRRPGAASPADRRGGAPATSTV